MQRQVVIKTPEGQPDKPVNFIALLGSILGVVSLAGAALFNVIDTRQQNAIAKAEVELRAEFNSRLDAQSKAMWQQFTLYFTKAEIEDRRKELDRWIDELRANDKETRQDVVGLKIHDASDHSNKVR